MVQMMVGGIPLVGRVVVVVVVAVRGVLVRVELVYWLGEEADIPLVVVGVDVLALVEEVEGEPAEQVYWLVVEANIPLVVVEVEKGVSVLALVEVVGVVVVLLVVGVSILLLAQGGFQKEFLELHNDNHFRLWRQLLFGQELENGELELGQRQLERHCKTSLRTNQLEQKRKSEMNCLSKMQLELRQLGERNHESKTW